MTASSEAFKLYRDEVAEIEREFTQEIQQATADATAAMTAKRREALDRREHKVEEARARYTERMHTASVVDAGSCDGCEVLKNLGYADEQIIEAHDAVRSHRG